MCCGTQSLAGDTKKADGYAEAVREQELIRRRFSTGMDDDETGTGGGDAGSRGIELTPMHNCDSSHVGEKASVTDHGDVVVALEGDGGDGGGDSGHGGGGASGGARTGASAASAGDDDGAAVEAKISLGDALLSGPASTASWSRLHSDALDSTLQRAAAQAERVRRKSSAQNSPVLSASSAESVTSDVESQNPPTTSVELLANISTVTNLRGYDQDELLRTANLNMLHDCDGAISHIKVRELRPLPASRCRPV